MALAEALILLAAWSFSCSAAASNDSFLNTLHLFDSCNRSRASHVCDPDKVLSTEEANRLDWLAAEMMTSTTCLCARSCPKKRGVKLGIFIKYDPRANISDSALKALAKHVRRQWSLGTCDDDILIVLLAETKQAAYDMGPAVEKMLTRRTARQIFNECSLHFENGYFYQGLESMVNSYRDALRAVQPMHPKFAPPSTSLIVGLSLGCAVLIVLLVATASLKCRQLRQTKALDSGKSFLAPQNTEATAFQYKLCRASDKDRHNSSSSSDEGIDSDDDARNETAKLNVPPFSDAFKRQLSDVVEENEEDIEAAAIKLAMVNVPKNSNTHVTEL